MTLDGRSKRNESVPNLGVRSRFELLAHLHGREQLAEHVALRLGWDTDGAGRRQEPYQYRRGLLVALGIVENRHCLKSDRIPSHRAADIHEILDQVEAGSVLKRGPAVAIPPPHREPVGPYYGMANL